MRHIATHPVVLVVAGLLLGSASLRAAPITSLPGLEGLGSYTGSAAYTALNGGQATLTIELTNTSPEANGGYLTAFAFNNPNNQVTGATLLATDADFGLLGGPLFRNGVAAPPFGDFDLGASTGRGWTGGGNPSRGVGVGDTETFTFHLTGTNLDLLAATLFFRALSEDAQGKGPQAFVARFRGFEDGGSDKVPGRHEQPEPTTVVLLALGAGGLALGRWRLGGKGR